MKKLLALVLALALLAGCAVVIKPSSVAPVTVMEFAKIAAGLDLPKGVLNVVTGGGGRAGDRHRQGRG